eukprot:2767205-Rhodomonas_salina.1
MCPVQWDQPILTTTAPPRTSHGWTHPTPHSKPCPHPTIPHHPYPPHHPCPPHNRAASKPLQVPEGAAGGAPGEAAGGVPGEAPGEA